MSRAVPSTTGNQRLPSLAMAGDGSFVVAWQSSEQDGAGEGVFARRYDPSGTALGAEFRLSEGTLLDQLSPSVAANERGDFVAAWEEVTAPTSSHIRARRFSALGAARGTEITVAINPNGIPGYLKPSVASDHVGNFAVAYVSGWLGNGVQPRLRRYQGLVPEALRVREGAGDGNGVLDPGEWVHVGSTWRNVNGATQTIAGTAPAVTGPAGATYTLLSASATYGSFADGDVAGCNPCYAVEVSNPATRPAAHWDAVLEERLLPDEQGQDKLWKLHVGHSFSDVPAASPFYRFAETLLHKGVTAGCAAGRFCPQGSTTREQMAVFVLLAREGAGYAPPRCTDSPFTDVAPGSPFCPWIQELVRRGVVQGCAAGLFCPTQAVSREQMATFLLRTLDPAADPPACAPPNMFVDVPESSSFCRWIEELARRGITSGCAGGAYCPVQPVTREQMGAFLASTFSLELYDVQP